MRTYIETELTCSQCNKQGTYTFGWDEDVIVCIDGNCGHTLSISRDLQLEEGEYVNFTSSGVLCVFSPRED